MPWVAGLSVRVLTHERAQTGHVTVVDALTDLVQRANLAGITVTRALEGLSDHSGLRSAGMFDLGEDLPLVVEIVDRVDRIEPLLPEIASIVTAGVLTVADVRLYFPASHLRVRDVMRPAELFAHEDTPLTTVLAMLLDKGARLVPVVTRDGTLRGIITLSHLLQQVDPALDAHLADPAGPAHLRLHLGSLAESQSAGQCMFPNPRTTRPEKGLDVAGRVFTTYGITRVPVVDANQRLVGILSEHDIVAALLAPPQSTAGEHVAALLAPPQSTAGEHVAALRMGVHPAAGEPLTAASLADRGVTVLPASASMDDVAQAIFGAREPLALVVDEAGRLIGCVNEHTLLAQALPEAPAGIRTALGRFFSRSSGTLTRALAGAHVSKEHARRAVDLAQAVPVSVAPDTPAADALARMIVPPGYNYAVIVLPDHKPDGVVWRQTALRALVGG